MSGKATAMKLSKEKWLSRVQSAREKGENGTGGLSTITRSFRGSEARSFLRIRGTREVRLKDANIAKIKNVDLSVHVKYLSN